MKTNKLVLAVGVLAVVLFAIGAIAAAALLIGDEDSKSAVATPEIVKSSPGSGAASSEKPEIVTVTSGGAVTLQLLGAASASTVTPALGLTVRGSGSATVKADQAFVVATLASRITGPLPAVELAAKDREAILAALTNMGISRDKISFETDLRTGPFASVSVETPIGEVTTTGKAVLDAIEKAVGRAQTTGVRFGVRDCNAALAPLRRAAFEAAEARAKELSSLTSLSLGPVVAMSEQGTFSPYGPVQDPCNPNAAVPKTAGLLPLDAPAEVKLSLDLTLTHALGEAAGQPQLIVTGLGSATAKANEAYVVVLVQPTSGPTGPLPLPSRDREAIIAKITALGIGRNDIEISSALFGGSPAVVSVEVKPDEVAAIGPKIVDAVESVVGRSQSSGVYFSHSNCIAVLGEAQRQALKDAAARGEALAAAADFKLGGLAAVSAASVQQSPYAGLTDPCNQDLSLLAIGSPYGLTLKPFETEAEFEVKTALTVSYALVP